MASTAFTDAVTLTAAAWFNAVDTESYQALTAVAGTNTITATGPVSLTAYATGQAFRFIPANTNTGATTINISSLGAKNIFASGVACVGGELPANIPTIIIYDGTQFNLVTSANQFINPNYVKQTLTDVATINWDTNLGAIATITLAANRTMAAPTNLKTGTYILIVIQDGVGSRTITWNAVFKWAAGASPVLSTAINAKDIISFFCDGTNLYGSMLRGVA